MSDKDSLPQRGIPYFAIVDASGVAQGGTSTIAQLLAKGMRPICAVDSSGSASGTSIATLRTRGIAYYCPVDQNGAAADATTMATLRQRDIPAFCLVSPLGVPQGGSDTLLQLRQRGIPFFCPLDESGNEIAGTPPSGPGAGSPMGLLLTLTYAS